MFIYNPIILQPASSNHWSQLSISVDLPFHKFQVSGIIQYICHLLLSGFLKKYSYYFWALSMLYYVCYYFVPFNCWFCTHCVDHTMLDSPIDGECIKTFINALHWLEWYTVHTILCVLVFTAFSLHHYGSSATTS